MMFQFEEGKAIEAESSLALTTINYLILQRDAAVSDFLSKLSQSDL